ncbi:hypothetical protein [Catenuloplanes japonicus]|uniref:hypothetical protein n=1 Tax=Catenuloplanes japonicus TaxID=33876 RepID=UPI000524D342|nr:hypothetical protein [Catenuloplanes japonicus]
MTITATVPNPPSIDAAVRDALPNGSVVTIDGVEHPIPDTEFDGGIPWTGTGYRLNQAVRAAGYRIVGAFTTVGDQVEFDVEPLERAA